MAFPIQLILLANTFKVIFYFLTASRNILLNFFIFNIIQPH